MWIIRIILFSGGAGLAAAIFWALEADARGLGPVLQEMLSDPWSVVTLIDLYLGFFISAIVMVLVERRLWIGILLAIPVFVLGNVWTALWALLRLPRVTTLLQAGKRHKT